MTSDLAVQDSSVLKSLLTAMGRLFQQKFMVDYFSWRLGPYISRCGNKGYLFTLRLTPRTQLNKYSISVSQN